MIVLILKLLLVVVNGFTVAISSWQCQIVSPSFSDEDFLHITIINSVLCFVPGPTDSAWPTERLLFMILGGPVKTR